MSGQSTGVTGVTNCSEDILIRTIEISSIDGRRLSTGTTDDGIETRRGDVIAIEGNQFELHYVDNVEETETIPTSHSEATLENSDLEIINSNVGPGVEILRIEGSQQVGINEASTGVLQNQISNLVSPNSQFISIATSKAQPSAASRDFRTFQLGNSGQFLRLALSEDTEGEGTSLQHEFFLSDISSGEFIKLPGLSIEDPLESVEARHTVNSNLGTSVRNDTDFTTPPVTTTTPVFPGIVTVTIDDENDHSKAETETRIPGTVENNQAQISKKSMNATREHLKSKSLQAQAQTISVAVPGGLSLEMQRYIFTNGLCRVCLLVKEHLVSLFEDVVVGSTGLVENSRGANSASRFNIIPAIKTLLDIDVFFGDSLPDQICMDCLDNLTAFSIFRKKISLGQTKLSEILHQVKNSMHPTVIPPLGELDISRTGVFRQTESIISAKNVLSTSNYSHLVVRNLSDRVWDILFLALSNMVGFKSGKLKELQSYCLESPYVQGWFCSQCNITIHGPRKLYIQHFQEIIHVQPFNSTEVCYPCDVCGNSFHITDSTGNSENYAEHWIQHFFFCECDLCGKRMPSMKGVWIHKRSAHAKDGQVHSCPICAKTFQKKAHLVNHERTHLTSEERKKFMTWCSICEKHFTCSLTAHMARVHSDERPWKCEHCSKTFKRKEILSTHRESVHSTEKKYSCEICGLALKSQSTKRLHVLRHAGERPHACNVCNKRFFTSSSLQSHAVKHKDVPDIICDVCGKAFKRKVYLLEHLRLHTGEKPHECPICGKHIRMKSNYFKHLNVHKKRDLAKLTAANNRNEAAIGVGTTTL